MPETSEHHRNHRLAEYAEFVDEATLDRIRQKAEPLRGVEVMHVNSTFYGGGVAEILSSLSLLMNDVGLTTDWRIIKGAPEFFEITKGIHNALQGGEGPEWTDRQRQIYRDVVFENSIRMNLDQDFVVVHDPQPLPLLSCQPRKSQPWFWRCHIDMSDPDPATMEVLRPFAEQYDAAIVTLEEYRRDLEIPQYEFYPAIDPFTEKNRPMSDDAIDAKLDEYEIPQDRPLVTQVSRFDVWKDPIGVIDAFEYASDEVDARLVLLGSAATDDPEGQEVQRRVVERAEASDEPIHVIGETDSVLVNALQRRSEVVLQKSLREGFGLTVTEAMWKGTPVIGGDVGGIRYQIDDGENGYLVSSPEEAGERIVELLQDDELREAIGSRSREGVRSRFLMTRLLERYVDLFDSVDYRFSVGF